MGRVNNISFDLQISVEPRLNVASLTTTANLGIIEVFDSHQEPALEPTRGGGLANARRALPGIPGEPPETPALHRPATGPGGAHFRRHKHFDTDELLADLDRAKKTISRATVYRTLLKLVEAGLLRRIEIGVRTVYDHDYGYPQHEHLVCERCGTMIEFQHPAIDAALRQVAMEHNFRSDGHSLVVRGICAECNAATAARRRLVM